MSPAILLAAALAVAPDAPLSLRTQGTLRELFLDPTLADARPPARPELDVRWSAANTWATPTTLARGGQTARLETDEQADSLTLSARLPWSRLPGLPAWLAARGASALEWRLTAHWGGWTDSVISTWHRVIQVYDFQRRAFTRDVVAIRLGAASGARPAIDVRGARLAPGDLVLRSQVALLRGGESADGARDRWAVALRGDLKAPTGPVSAAGGSGGFDGAAALVASGEPTPWLTLHAMASLSLLSPLPRSALLQPQRWQHGAELSLAFHSGAWAFLVEDRVSSPLLTGGWTYSGTTAQRRSSAFAASFRSQNQVSLGVRRGPFTFWFSEDVTPGKGDGATKLYYLSNAPDFAFGVGWRTEL